MITPPLPMRTINDNLFFSILCHIFYKYTMYNFANYMDITAIFFNESILELLSEKCFKSCIYYFFSIFTNLFLNNILAKVRKLCVKENLLCNWQTQDMNLSIGQNYTYILFEKNTIGNRKNLDIRIVQNKTAKFKAILVIY